MLKNKFYFILERIDLKYEINAILLLAPCVQLEGYKNIGIFNILQIVIGFNSHLILNEDIWNPANHFEILFGFGSTEKCFFLFKSKFSGKYLERQRFIHKISIWSK